MGKREKWVRWFAGACVLLGLVRLLFGVDFTDEAYYLAIPYRFVLGDRPFVDELEIHQTAGLLVEPWVRLHLWLVGDTGGIVLAARVVYFLFTLLVAGVVYLSIRERVERVERGTLLLAALLPVVFLPFGLPGLSYNTLGSGFLTIGLFTLYRYFRSGGRSLAAISGAGIFLACAAYPTLAPVYLLALMLLLARRGARGGRLSQAASFVAPGVALAALIFVPALWHAGAGSLRYFFQYNTVGKGDVVGKVRFILKRLALNFPIAGGASGALGFVLLRWGRRGWSMGASTALVLLGFVLFQAHYRILWLGVAAGIALWKLERDPETRRSLGWVWALSMVAGALTSWSSNNGPLNACIGLVPAVVCGFVALIRNEDPGRPLPLARLGIFVLLSSFVVSQWTSVYDDDAFWTLRAPVRRGPYAGLLTSREKRKVVDAIGDAVRRNESRAKRVIFYNYFPGGYLFASKPPGIDVIWVGFPGLDHCGDKDRSEYARSVLQGRDSTLVFQIRKLFVLRGYQPEFVTPPEDPMERALASKAPRLLEEDPYFSVKGVGF